MKRFEDESVYYVLLRDDLVIQLKSRIKKDLTLIV